VKPICPTWTSAAVTFKQPIALSRRHRRFADFFLGYLPPPKKSSKPN